MSEQSPLCSDVFFASGRCICRKKAAVAPLPCSSFSAKGPARLACSLASALTTARCRYQPFAAAAPCGAGDGPGRTRRTEKTRRRSRQYGVRPSEKPPRRRIVLFAPTPFCACGKKDVIRPLPSSFLTRIIDDGLRFLSQIHSGIFLSCLQNSYNPRQFFSLGRGQIICLFRAMHKLLFHKRCDAAP